MTSRGTRKPARQLLDHARPACPGGAAPPPSSRVAHGVVPCARSPSTVAEPVVQRRPTARYCMGERSCASSSTTWPERVRALHQVGRLVDQHRVRRRPLRRLHAPGRLRPQDRLLLVLGRGCPSACAARNSASDSSRSTSFAGSTGGQIAFTAAFTAGVAGHRVLHPVVRRLARPAPSAPARRARSAAAGPRGRRRSGCRGPATPVTISSSSYAGPASGASRAPPRTGSVGQRHMRTDRPPQHLRHPRVALDDGRGPPSSVPAHLDVRRPGRRRSPA